MVNCLCLYDSLSDLSVQGNLRVGDAFDEGDCPRHCTWLWRGMPRLSFRVDAFGWLSVARCSFLTRSDIRTSLCAWIPAFRRPPRFDLRFSLSHQSRFRDKEVTVFSVQSVLPYIRHRHPTSRVNRANRRRGNFRQGWASRSSGRPAPQ